MSAETEKVLNFTRAASLFQILGFGVDKSRELVPMPEGESGFTKTSQEIAELRLPFWEFLQEIGTFERVPDGGGMPHQEFSSLSLQRNNKPNRAMIVPTPGTGNNAHIKGQFLNELYRSYLALSVEERVILLNWIRTDPYSYTIPIPS